MLSQCYKNIDEHDFKNLGEKVSVIWALKTTENQC